MAHLKGCASSSSSSSSRSSMDSQYPVGVRLETGHQAMAMVASCASPVGGQSGAVPEVSSSSSSFNPAPKHTAFVELCCGPKSLIGKEALKKGLKLLRVTRESHDLSQADGRSAVCQDVSELSKDNRIHLWASLPCRPWSQLNELNGRKLGKKFISTWKGYGKNQCFY